jgi:serine phosphatase RsbU (regulator of sigma subunit)
MSLRARLILAFVMLSVLPLTAVTLLSYRSSLEALRNTAETEASLTAVTMTMRMDAVTKNINRQLERLSQLQPASTLSAFDRTTKTVQSDSKAAAVMVTTLLGQTAEMLDRLEFVASVPDIPQPPAPPGGRPATSPSPAAGAPQTVVVPRSPIVVDLGQLARTLGANQERLAATEEQRRAQAAALQFVTELVSAGLKMRSEETAKAAQAELEALTKEVEVASQQRATERGQSQRLTVTPATGVRWKGGAIGVPVRRDGHVVGTVNARVNLERVLGEVLSAPPGDAGEISFAIDPDHNLHTPRPQDQDRMRRLDVVALADAPPGTHRLGDGAEWVVVTRKDPTGLTFGIARPLGEPLREIRRVAGRNLSFGLTLIGLALIGIVPLSGRMTRNLKTLTAGVQQIARGDLKVRVPVRSRDEFGRLAGAFNQMAADLNAHQQLLVTQERMQRELELCRQIQNEMLPREPLHIDLAEVQGVSIPAREVGGDFFNYFILGENEVALLVGDVAGKGVGAALLMANIQATLRARLPLERDLAKLADAIDREIERSTPRPVYLTLFAGILDTQRKTLRYVNAGHNPQYVLRAGGGVRRLPSTGLPVGMFAGHGYEERTESLAEGDLLFFYTDGMVEVENEQGEFFDIQQLEQLLVAEQTDDIATLLARVEQAVRSFRGAAEALDDATMMALRFGKTPVTPEQPVSAEAS